MTAENEAAAKGQGAPRVSIIVPVYNVEACLRRCLDSMLAQTIPDWECICVDNGSPDGWSSAWSLSSRAEGRANLLKR